MTGTIICMSAIAGGTIFKIARDRQIFVFATLEASVSAYHLAFGPHGDLFVTGPTTSSFDCVHKSIPRGISQLSIADWDGRRVWLLISKEIFMLRHHTPESVGL